MGVLLLFNGGFILLSSIVSLIFNDGVTTEIFSAGVTVLIFGLILVFSTRNHEKQIQRREGYWQHELMTFDPWGLNTRDELNGAAIATPTKTPIRKK